MFLFLYNRTHLPSLQVQLQDLLHEAQQMMEELRMLEDSGTRWSIPDFNLRVNNPHLPYQTNVWDKRYDAFTSQNKRIIHLKCGETAAPFLLQLFGHIKTQGIMRRTFEKYILVTEPLTREASGKECSLLCRMSQLHTNDHNSIQLHSLTGIINIAAHRGTLAGP